MSVSQFENSFIQCFDDSLTDYCQHLLLAFPKLPIFGATDGHSSSSSNNNMPHISQQDKFLYNCIYRRLYCNPASPAKPPRPDNARHYFYINCMPLAWPVAFHPANCQQYLRGNGRMAGGEGSRRVLAFRSDSIVFFLLPSQANSNCHLMRHARHLRTTHDYQFGKLQLQWQPSSMNLVLFCFHSCSCF